MITSETRRRLFLAMLLILGCLALLSAPPRALAQTCEDACNNDYQSCLANCENYPVWTGCPNYCESDREACWAACPPE